MKAKLFFALLLLSKIANGQNKTETIVNFASTSLDMAMTCHNLASGGHEYFAPSQNCATISALNFSRAFGFYYLDRQLTKHNRAKWAHFQLISIGITSNAIRFSIQHKGF